MSPVSGFLEPIVGILRCLSYSSTYNSLFASIAMTVITEKSLCFVSISVAGSQPINVLTGISLPSLTI